MIMDGFEYPTSISVIYYLHFLGYGLPLREDVSQVPGAQDVPQGGSGQQPGQNSEGPAGAVRDVTWQTRYSRPRWSRR